jgi:hypothetical protein
MPHVCVTAWPGSSTSRSSAVTKAFGGQVMGSMASALRRRSGLSGSPVKTCSQPAAIGYCCPVSGTAAGLVGS